MGNCLPRETRKRIIQLPLVETHQGKEKNFLPLIALIYADQEVLFLPSA
jgi:hypothetical protein